MVCAPVLPDLLTGGLDLVLCGTAPSRKSMEAQAYYAHPGNIFWKTLFEAGLTPSILQPKTYPDLLRHGIGLTDLNKTESGADSQLSRAAFDVAAFRAKMLRFRPKAIGFTSKFAASKYFNRAVIAYGLQLETLDKIPLFVLPSTSGRARRYFDIGIWCSLASHHRICNSAGAANHDP